MSSSHWWLKEATGTDDKGVRTYTKVFGVTTSDTTLGPGQVATLAPGFLYDSWLYGSEVDAYALLVKKSAKSVQSQGGIEWEVTCEYTSEPLSQNANTGTATSPADSDKRLDPDVRPWTIETGTLKTTKILRDKLGDSCGQNLPITNSAGQCFDPPIEIPKSATTITFTGFKALNADSLNNKLFYEDTINSANANVLGVNFPARTARVNEYQLKTQFEKGFFWWEKKVVIEYNPDKWNPIQILDQGAYEIVGGKYKQLTDENGNPSVLPLNGAGQKLAPGGCLVYLNKDGYTERNFAGII